MSRRICYSSFMSEAALDRRLIAQRGKRLEYFTIAWNTLEGLVAVIAGAMAGIILAIVSLIVMPLLSKAKGRVGHELGSAAMNADAKQSQFCSYLSAILLSGLLLNAALGWWWADPLAALIMTPIIAREGLQGIRGENRCHECC